MNKKSVLILLSTLHICIFLIGIVFFNGNDKKSQTVVAEIPDKTIQITEAETETIITSETQSEENTYETIYEPKTEISLETEVISETESISEIESTEILEDKILYTFTYSGTRKLNIRKGPSTNDEIIGKVPHNGKGEIIEFIDKNWALIKYNEITGYSNITWMIIEENTDN